MSSGPAEEVEFNSMRRNAPEPDPTLAPISVLFNAVHLSASSMVNVILICISVSPKFRAPTDREEPGGIDIGCEEGGISRWTGKEEFELPVPDRIQVSLLKDPDPDMQVAVFLAIPVKKQTKFVCTDLQDGEIALDLNCSVVLYNNIH